MMAPFGLRDGNSLIGPGTPYRSRTKGMLRDRVRFDALARTRLTRAARPGGTMSNWSHIHGSMRKLGNHSRVESIF
jgi:hypothetical protein